MIVVAFRALVSQVQFGLKTVFNHSGFYFLRNEYLLGDNFGWNDFIERVICFTVLLLLRLAKLFWSL